MALESHTRGALEELDSRLFVFSTQRAITQFYASRPQGLMPRAITIGDLFSQCFFTPQRIYPSSDILRVILYDILRDLLHTRPALTRLFVFDQSFLGFLQGSDFLLPFFRDLAQHGVDIAQIPLKDIYADYAEHLEILEEISARFNARLDELGLARLDGAQEIISEFAGHFERIEIFLDGFLSPREREQLYLISQHTPLHIHIQTDWYNYKYFNWLCGSENSDRSGEASAKGESGGEQIAPNFCYTFLLDSADSATIDSRAPESTPRHEAPESKKPRKTPPARLLEKLPAPRLPTIECYGFELRLGQCSFVLEKVRELLSAGVRGEEIIIITPDESFSEYFALLDSALNLNYAMGRTLLSSPKHAAWYKLLREILLSPAIIELGAESNALGIIEAIFMHIFDTKAGAQADTRACDRESTPNPSAQATDMDSSDIDSSRAPAGSLALPEHCIRALEQLPPCPLSALEQHKILSLLFDYRLISPSVLGFEQIIELVLLAIESLSLDDTRGGKVRVMGILETRSLACQYAIVVDCNHGFIPRIKESDVFLNTAIRQSLGMPTLQDRENLQKHYYQRLFASTSKQVFLTYTANEEARESSLIDELCLHHEVKKHDGDALYALFPPSTPPQYAQEEIIGEIAQWLGDFRFSSTSLNAFITCKRRFYLRYVLDLREPQDRRADITDSKSVGILVHEALESALRPYLGEWLDERAFKAMERECERILRAGLGENAAQRFECELVLRMLGGFWRNEKQLAREQGLKILACEQSFTTQLEHNGKHAKLTGKLDRIDMLGDGTLRVLDYKWGEKKSSQKSSHNLQLALYKLALESTPDIASIFSAAESSAGDFGIDSGVDARIYYLKSSAKEFDYKLEDKAFEQAKATILEALELASGRISFDMTQDAKQCAKCVYAKMCNRA